MKHLHRLIVTRPPTAWTRRATSRPRRIDRDNRYLWRFRSRRLEAEVVRDSLLYVAGQLDLTQGGPEIDHNQGLTSRRRSLYFRHAAEKQMAFLKLFDAAAVTECYQRKESIVPQQALALANSELTLVQARLLARRLAEAMRLETGRVRHRRLRAGAHARRPRPTSWPHVPAFLEEQAELLKANESRLAGTTSDPADGGKPSADVGLRARENLVHVLLNHHEFVTMR